MKNIFKRILGPNSSFSMFFNYLKREFIIILILCSGTVLIYGILGKSLENQIINVNRILLQNTIDSIEKEFSNMNELLSLINSNPRVIRHMNMPGKFKKNDQSYNAYQVKKDLNTYVYSTRFVKGIIIFFNNDDVISNEYKTDFDFYFGCLDKSGYDIKSLVSTFNHRKLVYTKDEEGNLKGLYCISSLPVGNRNIWRATVIIEIDLEVIASFLIDNQFTKTTETVLLNAEQVPILRCNSTKESWEGIDVIKTSVKSQDLGWVIESIIPETEFVAQYMAIKSSILSILFLSLIVGLIFAVFFSYKYYQPIARLIGMVSDDRINVSSEGIFNQIEKSMSETISENKELKNKVQRQTEHLTSNAVEKLLIKGIIIDKSTDDIVDMSDIGFNSSKFIVLSIKPFINGIYDHSDILNRLQEMLKEEQDGYVFYQNESNIAILVDIINEQIFNPIEFGNEIIKRLYSLGIQSVVGIGSICYSVKDINRSYKEALLSLNALHKDKNEVIIYDYIKDLVGIETKYYYPVNVEQEIINNVKAGNIDRVKLLLEDVYSQNFTEIQLSNQISKILVYNIVSTAVKIMYDLKIDLSKLEDINLLKQLYNAETVNDAYSSLITTYTIICQLVNKNKRSSNKRLFESIEQYVREEYNNPDISLTLIANRFNLSISYLSRFFKENAGINFNDYIHKLRIENAKQLFRISENILVEDVAFKVGYNNSAALIRAFKKYEGITPGEYRASFPSI